MWRRGNMGNMMNNPGELNKADIEYAVKRFLNDASDYANTTPIARPSKFKLLLKNIYDR
jgi:hypothetical protein